LYLLSALECAVEYSTLAMAGVVGVPSLFEIGEDRQTRPVSLVEHDGLPSIALRLGSVITRQLVDELNALVGNTYHERSADALASADASSEPPNAP
jgi:hypothetical protein